MKMRKKQFQTLEVSAQVRRKKWRIKQDKEYRSRKEIPHRASIVVGGVRSTNEKIKEGCTQRRRHLSYDFLGEYFEFRLIGTGVEGITG